MITLQNLLPSAGILLHFGVSQLRKQPPGTKLRAGQRAWPDVQTEPTKQDRELFLFLNNSDL